MNRYNPSPIGTAATAIVASLLLFSILPETANAARTVDYAAEIQPILRSSCYSCHQGEKAAAGLHLDSKPAALAGGLSGKAIVAGSSKDSLIVKRLLSSDPRLRMPFGGTPLQPEKIALIRAWIDQGAVWPDEERTLKHWAYSKPARPAVPKVNNAAWVRNPIDAFVLARLEKEGLQPSPQASKEILIRRVSLDLIGLPPTPEEI